MQEYSLESMRDLFAAQQRACADDMNPPAAKRDERLARLAAMIEQHQQAIAAAISADFGHRSPHETALAEVFVTLAGIAHARRHLSRWMKPQRVPTPLHFRPGYSRVMRQPLGVVGIVSPWNYPLQLALAPALAAIAAGNRVMLKPSELTPGFAELLQRLVGESFSAAEVAVVTGSATVGRAFVELPFDHLLFTGSTAVGRQVALAAAQNLTPVTLELGGKSPALLDTSCDFNAIAERLIAGKLLNAGQTCIAPDYLLLPAGRQAELVAALRTAVAKLYPTLASNSDYTSIVNPRHHQRLSALLDDARSHGAELIEINPAGESFSATQRKMPLYLVLGATPQMAVMQEEIFGPILPLLTYETLDQAIAYINGQPRPLALYWFGRDPANRDRVLAQTIAGGVTVNDTLWHIAVEDLPFGGVGASGQGAYHGETGFLTFSKQKPVFFQSRLAGARLLYPPYGKLFAGVLALLRRLT